MNPDDLTGWDLLIPRHPLHMAVWLLVGILLGWMIRMWWLGRKQ